MPQPALHLLLASRTLDRWRSHADAPFDVHDDDAVNAFLHGSLGPDMGNFPGGSRRLGHLVHTCRTGDVQRNLLELAKTEKERAYAWGWLSHILADVLIHPLVNEAAAQIARTGEHGIIEHVRVEVGLDVWFCSRERSLGGLRLRPAFDRKGYAFLARALNGVAGAGLTTTRLAQMERGLMMFSHGALHFATSVGRQLSWGEDVAERVPLGSAIAWHAATTLSPRNSVINAWLTPVVPAADLIARVGDALARFGPALDAAVDDDARSLPNYNLEDGTLSSDKGQRVA